MPCSDNRSPGEERESFYRDFEHNSEVAEMLCWVMGKIEVVEGYEGHVTQDILGWWEAHKERDTVRLEKQFSKISGIEYEQELAKLSDYERNLLGL